MARNFLVNQELMMIAKKVHFLYLHLELAALS
ncbi:unnamed protein product [Schistosoma curassoni]|uniref:Uncharacterized protein n=1 Tax=Schistosoma curassoni TaxID=6186 RepID=A0A183L1K5_9TREM|nr:unnamed protein product [Schistosoma curassoni]